MKKLYSNADDCLILSKYINKKMGKKIKFCRNKNQKVVCGKQFLHYKKIQNNSEYLVEDELPFYFTFCKNEFLRFEIGSYPPFENAFGEKLSALSSFYEILNEQFGEPTAFYTLKDEERTLVLHWVFVNKEEEIQNFKNGSYFDDNELDELIVIGEQAPQTENYQLIEETKKEVARKIGLPFELTHLIDDDFVKYKTRKEIELPKVYQDEAPELQKKTLKINSNDF